MGSHLIDSTEMYVRTVWELEEEGIPPIRARLSERLQLSAPSVSETVARLEDEGLLHLGDDRTLELTPEGRRLAVSVMRKHRLAERLLVDVIGIGWADVHPEACRWEHVISDEVEERLVELLDSPTHCPHGNPIPGLVEDPGDDLVTLDEAADDLGEVTVARISEQLQGDVQEMTQLAEAGVGPEARLRVERDGDGVALDAGRGRLVLDATTSQLIYVRAAD